MCFLECYMKLDGMSMKGIIYYLIINVKEVIRVERIWYMIVWVKILLMFLISYGREYVSYICVFLNIIEYKWVQV